MRPVAESSVKSSALSNKAVIAERAPAAPVPTNATSMTPTFLRIAERVQETADVVTLELAVPSEHEAAFRHRPGQFDMLYVFGVGEVPISISGDATRHDRVTHTVRAVGPVSTALTKLGTGDVVGVRGPFGNPWPLDAARGADVLVIAGGIGLMPLRPVILHLLRNRGQFGRVSLLYGAKRRDDLLFRDELSDWRRHPDLEVRVALNEADRDWTGDVGFVTQLLPKVGVAPADTVAFLCGPEIMIRATGRALVDIGMSARHVHASMERNMKCALGTCGHCQLGPLFICRDGPVFSFDRIDPLMSIREL